MTTKPRWQQTRSVGLLRQQSPSWQMHLTKYQLWGKLKFWMNTTKELLSFAAASECDWASTAPHLFGQNFLKESSEYLQKLQLLRKVKEKPSSSFWQPPLQSQQGSRSYKSWKQPPYAQTSDQPKKPSFRKNGCSKTWLETVLHTHCKQLISINDACQSYVGQSKRLLWWWQAGRPVLTKDRWILETIKGFQTPFVGQPVQIQRPSVPTFSSELAALLQEEIVSLQEKGQYHWWTTHSIMWSSIPSYSWFPKEQENETSNKPEGPESMSRDSTFQNGRPNYSLRFT